MLENLPNKKKKWIGRRICVSEDRRTRGHGTLPLWLCLLKAPLGAIMTGVTSLILYCIFIEPRLLFQETFLFGHSVEKEIRWRCIKSWQRRRAGSSPECGPQRTALSRCRRADTCPAPASSHLSQVLKKNLTPILPGLLEVNTQKMLTFEKFSSRSSVYSVKQVMWQLGSLWSSRTYFILVEMKVGKETNDQIQKLTLRQMWYLNFSLSLKLLGTKTLC